MNKIFLSFFLFSSLIAGAQHKIAVSDVTNIKIRVPQITKTDAAYAEVNKDSTSLYCTEPTASNIKAFCDCIAIQEKPADEDKTYFEYGYERRLMDMACADYKNESQEATAIIIKKWWDKHKTKFRCQSTAFNVDKGSVLKFAMVQGFKPFIENIVGAYDLDINFVDLADNLNVWDYVNDELKEVIKDLGESHPRVKMLKEYRIFLEDLGGKPSKPAK